MAVSGAGQCATRPISVVFLWTNSFRFVFHVQVWQTSRTGKVYDERGIKRVRKREQERSLPDSLFAKDRPYVTAFCSTDFFAVSFW